jgi:hypothetical protein
MDATQRLDRLENIVAIETLIARYGKAVDNNGRADLVTPLFTDDAVWHCEGIGHWETLEGIVREIRPNCTTFMPWAMHYLTQPIVEIATDGKSATANFYLWELAKVTVEGRGGTQDTWIGGWYDTKCRKEGNAWKFSRIDLTLKLFSETDKPSWQTRIAPWAR